MSDSVKGGGTDGSNTKLEEEEEDESLCVDMVGDATADIIKRLGRRVWRFLEDGLLYVTLS